MSAIAPAQLRNVAILGHSHEGKTSFAEAILYAAGTIERLGRPDSGTATLDFEPEEVSRHLSIAVACASATVGDVKINLLDTPGFFDFASDVRHAVAVADAVVIVAAAGDHPSVGTELAWELAEGKPKLLVVNKLDKENADFTATLEGMRGVLVPRPVAVQVPIGQGSEFRGVLDLLSGTAHGFDEHGRSRLIEVPAEMTAVVEAAQATLAEAAAEGDDELLAKFLEGEELTVEEIRRGLHEGVAAGVLVPAVPCSATRLTGIGTVLMTMAELLPSPEEEPQLVVTGDDEEPAPAQCQPHGSPLAFVFKTTTDPFVGRLSYFKVLCGEIAGDSHLFNPGRGVEEKVGHIGVPRGKGMEPVRSLGAGDIGVVAKLQHTHTGDTLCAREGAHQCVPLALPQPGFAMAIHPRNRDDDAKIGPALQHLLEEDPGLRLERSDVTKEHLLVGFGDVQLEVTREKLKRKYGVDAELAVPRVPLMETITRKARGEKKYKKQSGGAGLYGHAVLEVSPGERGSGFTWEDRVVGGAIPQAMRPSVERGVRETMEAGIISGNRVVDVRVALVDGSTHPVDGKDLAFRLAGSMAMREAVVKADPVLLEPVMEVTANVPDRHLGEVMSDVTARRGKIIGTNQLSAGRAEIVAHVPQTELQRYALELRSLTQGRGRFSLRYSHSEEMPAHLALPIVTAHQREHAGREE